MPTGTTSKPDRSRNQGFSDRRLTGEGPYLEPGERASLIATARHELGKRPFLLAGVGAESLRLALAQADEAATAGADAILVLTPTSLVRGNHAAVTAFFSDVADAAPIPVFLYSVPGVTRDLPASSRSRAQSNSPATPTSPA